MIGPKHTFESVVRELREGLENGVIVLDRTRPDVREATNQEDWNLLRALPGIAAASPKFIYLGVSQSLNLSEELLKTLVANEAEIACEPGVEKGKANVRSYIFRAQKKTGFLFTRTRQLHLSVTFFGNEVKYLAGDVSEIQNFEIPPEIKKAIDDSLAAAKTIIPVLLLEQEQGR